MRNKAFYALLATVLLSGCSKDEGSTSQPTDGRVVLEATSGIKTRAYDNTWEANDAIGIYMLNGDDIDGNGNNRQYTTASEATTGSFTAAANDIIYLPMDGTKRNFIAYYPYRAILAEDNLYAIDVTTQTPQKTIDLMGAAKVEGKDKTDPAVAFIFTHKLVKLAITIQADGTSLLNSQLAGTTATITNQQTKATYNVVTGGNITVTEGGEAKEITLYTDRLKAEGIVLPAASTEDMKLIFTVPLLNQTFSWSINSAEKSKTFEAGHKYLYTITISKSGLKVTSTVENWTPGNGNGENGNAQ